VLNKSSVYNLLILDELGTKGHIMRLILLATFVLIYPGIAAASDCWVAGKFQGQSAMSDKNYNFVRDGFADGMLICFSDSGGRVTGSDLSLTRFGESTLIGFSKNDKGLETVNVYQLDRKRGKLLITQSRIGTATEVPILPDYTAAYVGDAVPSSQ